MRSFPRPLWILLIYAVLLGSGILIIRTLEVHLLLLRTSWQLYSAGLAIVFLLLGVWLSGKFRNPVPQSPPPMAVEVNPGKAS